MKINSEMKLVGSIDELNIKEKISSDIKLPGKENVKELLRNNRALKEEIETKVREHYGIGEKKEKKAEE